MRKYSIHTIRYRKHYLFFFLSFIISNFISLVFISEIKNFIPDGGVFFSYIILSIVLAFLFLRLFKSKYLGYIEVAFTKKEIIIKNKDGERLLNESIEDLEKINYRFILKNYPSILLKFKNGKKIKFYCYEKYNNEVDNLIIHLNTIFNKKD
ncbi:hypothetical protein [Tenacibaculum aiptasiae]|uniref:hypothetical protein n=1 Tax=Tenacibaculum aiptasiae TaxID=426481 RepID=UPI001C37C1D8|nr:hypothetical protein [Tenacibaculum aiptasiae]